MKKLKNTSKPNKSQNQHGRRDFLTKAILGTGALAMTPIPSKAENTEIVEPITGISEEIGPVACTPIDPEKLLDNWTNPIEHDAANPLNPPLNLDAVLNKNGGLFTYNASIPGPTIRAKGNTHIKVNLTNNLPGNNSGFARDKNGNLTPQMVNWAFLNKCRYVYNNCQVKPDVIDWQLGDWRVYGPHQQHTTNLHTHGLHVAPAVNQIDGTNSDNVLLRVIPLEDYANRYPVGERSELLKQLCAEKFPDIKPTQFRPLKMNERVYSSRYDFRLEDQGPIHYPGTFWYHPHPHGATFDQVAGGMAGFLIIDGDIEEKLDEQIKNTTKDGKNLGLRERLILVQRIIVAPPSESEGGITFKNRGSEATVHTNTVNGKDPGTAIFTMAPNRIERWRILNASVDGQGYFEYTVVNKAAFDQDLQLDCLTIDGLNVTNVIKKYNLVQHGKTLDQVCSTMDYNSILNITMQAANAAVTPPSTKTKRFSRSAKCQHPLTYSSTEGYQLYYDAVSQLNALLAKHSTPTNPKASNFPTSAKLHNLSYDGITLVTEDNKYTSRLVSSLELAPANRADFLFQAPPKAGVYTVWAVWTEDATDRPSMQGNPFLIVATVGVKGDPVTSGISNKADGNLNLEFPPVNPLLKPLSIEDCKAPSGGYRKRKVTYGGWGDASIPLSHIYPKESPVAGDKWNTMTIDKNKYGADNPMGHGFPPAEIQMVEGTNEEWTLENFSMTIYYDPNYNNGAGNPKGKMIYGQNFPKIGKMAQIKGAPKYGPVNPGQKIPTSVEPDNANGASINNLISKAADHPFHMHQNSFWILSIKNNRGEELLPKDGNGNPYPRWQDVVRIPRNGGRVVMRCPFPDYHGKYVNHCHLLQHEDWGMMQVIEVIPKGHTPREGAGPVLKKDPCFQWERPTTLQIFDHDFDLKFLNPEADKPLPPNFPDSDCTQKITQGCNTVNEINTNKFLTTSVAVNFTDAVAKEQPNTLSDNKLLYPGTRCG